MRSAIAKPQAGLMATLGCALLLALGLPSPVVADGRYDGWVTLPRSVGGGNWEGGSLDPETGIVYITSLNSPWIEALIPSNDPDGVDFDVRAPNYPLLVDGLPVTAEATPHHINLTDELLAGYSALYKVNPPLRTMTDVEEFVAYVQARAGTEGRCEDQARAGPEGRCDEARAGAEGRPLRSASLGRLGHDRQALCPPAESDRLIGSERH